MLSLSSLGLNKQVPCLKDLYWVLCTSDVLNLISDHKINSQVPTFCSLLTKAVLAHMLHCNSVTSAQVGCTSQIT